MFNKRDIKGMQTTAEDEQVNVSAEALTETELAQVAGGIQDRFPEGHLGPSATSLGSLMKRRRPQEYLETLADVDISG